jgi:hypothetical protein
VSGKANSGNVFLVARNPQPDSRLPYLVRLPLEGGLVLKARAPWPATARVYCHRIDELWPDDAEIVDDAAVLVCRRRGPAVDLVLDGPRQACSQFIFTEVRGRQAIFWQTQKTARAANPGGRIPRRRTLTEPVTITVDTRERYPYRFAQQDADTVRATFGAGDYAIHARMGGCSPPSSAKASTTSPAPSVRAPSPSSCNGWPSSHSPQLSSRPATAPSSSSSTSTATGSADQLARLQVRYPGIPIVFADTRRHAEDWTHLFLTTALTDTADPT